MRDCSKIEQSYKDLTPTSNPEEASALVAALKEINESRILNSDLYGNAAANAKEMQKDGVWTKDLPAGEKGATAYMNQSDGKPTAVVFKDGDREEVLHFDMRTARPSLDSVSTECSGRAITSSTVLEDGKAIGQYIHLPTGIEVEVDEHGAPFGINPTFGDGK
jgi:hypothetical protein